VPGQPKLSALPARIEFVKGYPSSLGARTWTTTFVVLTDDRGNRLSWRSSLPVPPYVQPGARVLVTGYVRDVRQGRGGALETILTRCTLDLEPAKETN